MYERMLNKQIVPEFDDLISYSGDCGALWIGLDEFLKERFEASRLVRFPYGNSYGWGTKYSRKSRHICDVYAEAGAFTAHFQISHGAVDTLVLGEYAQKIWEDRYPCGSGGWLQFRVLCEEHLEELKKLLVAKMTVKSK